jgi:OTU domain-containing protein 6
VHNAIIRTRNSFNMESLEDLQTRHRKEQKDLQGRITQKKKGATKKNRKGVNSECDELERKLKERQDQERATLLGEHTPDVDDVPDLDESLTDEPTNEVDSATSALEKTTLSEVAPSEDGQPRKRNRQKERLARRAAEQEIAVEEAKKEAANQPNPKEIERAIMLKDFQARGLVEKLIAPDGHCLFSAVADQLSQVGIPLGTDSNAELDEDQPYKTVRKAAARYIEGHPDDFAAFLDIPLDQYVKKIKDEAEWGGHVELEALSRTYNVKICVLQNGDPQTIEPGTGASEEKIWLAYYRHGFGLGEHYNSLRQSPSSSRKN